MREYSQDLLSLRPDDNAVTVPLPRDERLVASHLRYKLGLVSKNVLAGAGRQRQGTVAERQFNLKRGILQDRRQACRARRNPHSPRRNGEERIPREERADGQRRHRQQQRGNSCNAYPPSGPHWRRRSQLSLFGVHHGYSPHSALTPGLGSARAGCGTLGGGRGRSTARVVLLAQNPPTQRIVPQPEHRLPVAATVRVVRQRVVSPAGPRETPPQRARRCSGTRAGGIPECGRWMRAGRGRRACTAARAGRPTVP